MEQESIRLKDIIVEDRIRSEKGDIDGLTNSIREFGLICPILLARTSDLRCRLVAGGRRYLALERMGKEYEVLYHGRHYILRDEVANGDLTTKLRFQAIELEENVKRKDLSWQEQILGKQRLLETMQRIHGTANVGGRTKEELLSGTSEGFGIRKLASMLGESVGNVSRDLQIARATQVVPHLLHAESKESAFRRLQTVSLVAEMQTRSVANVQGLNDSYAEDGTKIEKNVVLYEGDFRDFVDRITEESIDFVCTDFPYASDVDQMSKHATGVADFSDKKTDDLMDAISDAIHATQRVLKPDRFAFFFFGFNYYCELLSMCKSAGLSVNPVPVVWTKPGGGTTQDPYSRYANSYEPILIVSKGKPKFVRVGQSNVILMPSVDKKIHINQKPLALIERFLLDTTAEGAVCLDWMCGSGTLGVACKKNKRRAILFEKDPIACQIAKSRL